MKFSTRIGASILTFFTPLVLALYGCVTTEPSDRAPTLPAPEGPSAEAAQALTGWQCACDARSEYMSAVSFSQGNALGCAGGVAYRCGSIPWCTRGNFTQCSDGPWCPPGWFSTSRRSGPSYCAGIMDNTSCSALPYPSGTYITCDAACALGFTQTREEPGMPSCDFDARLTCQR